MKTGNAVLRGLASLALLSPALALSAHADSATGTAASTIAVDAREGGEVRTVAPKEVGYSPSWGGVKDAGSHVVIEKVEHAGMFNATTSVVTTCAADAEGSYSFALSSGDAPCVRLIHRVYDGNDVEIGEALVRDISFGAVSSPGEGAFADTREESFQEAVSTRNPVALTYSTAWATNAASVSILAVQTKDGSGADIASPVTNVLFTADADAEGTHPWHPKNGGWRLLFASFDTSEDAIGEPYFADSFLKAIGFQLIVR